MSNNEIQKLTDKLFKSRLNCLLLSVSESLNECEGRFNFSILSKLFPALSTWKLFQDHTIYTLICTSHINKDVVELGHIEMGDHGFEQRFYLVKSRRLNALNISLLRTTLSPTLSEAVKTFDSTILFDFYPWGSDTFEIIKKAIADAPFSIAIMDGFNNIAHTEKETRPKEIKEYVNKFNDQGYKCLSVEKRFIFNELSYLLSIKSKKRKELELNINERIGDFSSYFGVNKEYYWIPAAEKFGWESLSLQHSEYTSDNIINFYVIPSLNALLSKQEFVLFEKLVPKWREQLERSLNEYSSKPVPKDRINDILKNRIGKRFADYVVNQLNTYKSHD